MNHMEERFLDYVDGHMSEADRAAFEKAIGENPRLKASFEQFKRVAVLEKSIASRQHTPGPAFSVKVMESLEKPVRTSWWLMPAGSLAVVLLALLLSHDFNGSYRSLAPPRTVQDAAPAITPTIPSIPPPATQNIPEGFRATEIVTDSRSGVEGFATPNTRVDVLFTFKDQDKKKKVATIARFSKVLSVGGQTQTPAEGVGADSKVSITLLVSERDAKRIELARTLGDLSLSLVGGEEARRGQSEDPDGLDLANLSGANPESSVLGEPSNGVMFTRDPKTGRLVKFKLNRGRWAAGSADSEVDAPSGIASGVVPGAADLEEQITVIASPALEGYLRDNQRLKLVAATTPLNGETVISENVHLKRIVRTGTETSTVVIAFPARELDAVRRARGTLKLLPAG